MRKTIAFGLLCSFQFSVNAADITPFSGEESYIGAGCAIVNAKGEILVTDNMIKIDGIKLDLKRINVSKRSKSWGGTDVKVNFSLDKGKLLENDGGFSVGIGKGGKLTFNYKGVQGNLKAFEQCYGAD